MIILVKKILQLFPIFFLNYSSELLLLKTKGGYRGWWQRWGIFFKQRGINFKYTCRYSYLYNQEKYINQERSQLVRVKWNNPTITIFFMFLTRFQVKKEMLKLLLLTTTLMERIDKRLEEIKTDKRQIEIIMARVNDIKRFMNTRNLNF